MQMMFATFFLAYAAGVAIVEDIPAPNSRGFPYTYKNKTIAYPVRPQPPVEAGEGFCPYIAADLPSFCTCTEATEGGDVACTVDLMGIDTIGVALKFEPCDKPLKISLDFTEADKGIDYPIADLTGGEDEHIPIPGLDIGIPVVGSAGVNAVVKIDGDVSDVTLGLGVDACISVPIIGDKCGADLPIPANPFPIMLLSGEYKFGNFCSRR